MIYVNKESMYKNKKKIFLGRTYPGIDLEIKPCAQNFSHDQIIAKQSR